MQVWGWEPDRCVDYVDVGWPKLAEVAVHEIKLLGCATDKSSVSVWVVDLSGRDPAPP